MERTTEVELKPCRNRERERSMAASDLTWWRVDAIESEALLKLDILVSWTRFVGGGISEASKTVLGMKIVKARKD